MRMPYGPVCYFPLKDAVDRILNDVRHVPEEILQLMVMTDEFRCMHSYWKPLKSEVDYNRKNLIYIMDQMHHIIDHSFRAKILLQVHFALHRDICSERTVDIAMY